MALFGSGQDDHNPAFWLATQVGKMGPSCPLTISHVGPARKHSLFGHKINPLSTKLICLRQPDIGLVFFLSLS